MRGMYALDLIKDAAKSWWTCLNGVASSVNQPRVCERTGRGEQDKKSRAGKEEKRGNMIIKRKREEN